MSHLEIKKLLMTRLDELTQKANEFNSIIKSIKEYSKDQTMTQDIKDSLTHWRKLLLDTLAEIKTIEPQFNESTYECSNS